MILVSVVVSLIMHVASTKHYYFRLFVDNDDGTLSRLQYRALHTKDGADSRHDCTSCVGPDIC